MNKYRAFGEKIQQNSHITVLFDEPMKNHTSFRIGGEADVFVSPKVGDIPFVVMACKNEGVPLTILGNGSNVLVGDKGIRGLVLSIGKNMADIRVSGNTVKAEAGALLSSVSQTALKASLSGMEFASGIPGSVGGAVFMNAGAYDGSIKDCVSKVKALDLSDFAEKEYEASALDLDYRHSRFQGENAIVTEAEFVLRKKDSKDIQALMEDLAQKRREKQPVEYPSAGSAFKRPKGLFAGKLIMDAGLKGLRVGGAVVSEKHAGFIINDGGASAEDVRRLMDEVIKRVEDKFGVILEPEVRFVGEF